MLGAIVMGGACACAGAAAAWILRARTMELRAWQQALLAMRAACLYSRSTCAQVLRAGAAEASCLLPIARAVELNGADAARLFSAQKRSRLLRPEEHAVLLSALRCISAGTREEMAEALSYAAERYAAFCAESEKKRDSDARLYVTLGTLTGACVYLILL